MYTKNYVESMEFLDEKILELREDVELLEMTLDFLNEGDNVSELILNLKNDYEEAEKLATPLLHRFDRVRDLGRKDIIKGYTQMADLYYKINKEYRQKLYSAQKAGAQYKDLQPLVNKYSKGILLNLKKGIKEMESTASSIGVQLPDISNKLKSAFTPYLADPYNNPVGAPDERGLIQRLTQGISEVKDKVVGLVKANPWTSAGIAAVLVGAAYAIYRYYKNKGDSESDAAKKALVKIKSAKSKCVDDKCKKKVDALEKRYQAKVK